MATISLHTLPDEDSYQIGDFGLSHASLCGRITYPSNYTEPLYIDKLVINLICKTSCTYTHQYDLDTITRDRVWWSDSVTLLKGHVKKVLKKIKQPLKLPLNNNDILEYDNIYEPEYIAPGANFDIPFEIALPDLIDNIPLLQPIYDIKNKLNGQPYSAKSIIELKAELHETNPPHSKNNLSFFGKLFNRPKLRVCSVFISPFIIWDPRIIPSIILSETKNWRSAPGTSPCEYDFEIFNPVVGPGDDLSFSYRVAINPKDERKGVRIKSVKFTFREHHLVGECRKFHSKAVHDIAIWEQSEIPNSSSSIKPVSIIISPKSDHFASYSTTTTSSSTYDTEAQMELCEIRSPTTTKEGLLSQRHGRGGGSGDGLYAEASSSIRIPSNNNNIKLNKINPSTPKFNDQDLPSNIAAVEIRHTVRVDVNFINIKGGEVPERLAFECSVTAASVGRLECERMLDEWPELVPTLSYEKIVGTEIWHPVYEPFDPVIPGYQDFYPAKHKLEGLNSTENDDDQDSNTSLENLESDDENKQQSDNSIMVRILEGSELNTNIDGPSISEETDGVVRTTIDLSDLEVRLRVLDDNGESDEESDIDGSNIHNEIEDQLSISSPTFEEERLIEGAMDIEGLSETEIEMKHPLS